jgi:hypothetical protein
MQPHEIEVCVSLAGGNPGALKALRDVWFSRNKDFPGVVLTLTVHGFSGSSIWYGYNDWALGDVGTFTDAVISKNAEMFTVMKEGRARWG